MHVRLLKKIKAYQFVGQVLETGAIVRFHGDLYHPPGEGALCRVDNCVFDLQAKLVKCVVRRDRECHDSPAQQKPAAETQQQPAAHTPRKRARIRFDEAGPADLTAPAGPDAL